MKHLWPKKLLVFLLTATILLSSGMLVPLLSLAGENDEVPILNQTASGDVSKQFFAWADSNAGVGAAVSAENGAYTFKPNASGGKYTNATQTLNITVDLAKTPYLYYEIEANTSFDLNLRADGNDNKHSVVKAAGTGSIALTKILPAGCVSNNQIKLNLFEFDMGEKVNDTTSYVTVKKLYLGPAPVTGTPILDQTANGNVSNQFFAWANSNAGVGAAVSAENGVYTFKPNASGGKYTNATQTLNITVDLTKTPYLYYEIEANTSFDLNLRADGEGNKHSVVKAAGTAHVALADILPADCISNNQIKLNLFEFDMGEKVNDTTSYVTIKKLYVDAAPEGEADQKAAAAVDAIIDALGEITLEKKADVEAARAAFDGLTAAQQALVTKLTVLTDAEKEIAKLEANLPENLDKKAAAAVDAKINGIGYVMITKDAYIASVREAYDALTDAQKALVTKLQALTDAEAKLAELKANPPAANTAKTETFLEPFNNNTFPLAYATSTTSKNDTVANVFGVTREENKDIYEYYFGSEMSKESGIMFKNMTEVGADIVYSFENGAKSLEFVGSYIWASIFRSAADDVFQISWSATADGTYTPFVVSDIAYERVAMDDKCPHYAEGKQSLAFYRIANIPAQARFIKLSFKASDPSAEYPYNYANWQAPLGYLKVESYLPQVETEDKNITDAVTGMKFQGIVPKASIITFADKSGSGMETAAARFVEESDKYNKVLQLGEVGCLLNNAAYTKFENNMKVSFPVKAAYGTDLAVLYYDEEALDFKVLPVTIANGFATVETDKLGNFVLIGNTTYTGDPSDPSDSTNSSGNDTDKPEKPVDTGNALPIAAASMALLTGAALAFTRKNRRK